MQLCRIPNWGPLWVALAPPGQPDKQRLMDVKDFFAYTEKAGEGARPRQGREEGKGLQARHATSPATPCSESEFGLSSRHAGNQRGMHCLPG